MDEKQQSPNLPTQSGPASTIDIINLNPSDTGPAQGPSDHDSRYHDATPSETYIHPHDPESSSSMFSSQQSPWAGLSENQTKELIKLNKTQNEEYLQMLIEEVTAFEVCQQRSPSKLELMSMMGQILDTFLEHRSLSFSSLTKDDFDKLRVGGERGDIFINEKAISEEMRDIRISDEFWSGLQATRQVMSRVKEMGIKQVIGHFLIHATLIARQMFKEERLIVHSEYEVGETEIPTIGKVHGPLDFMTSRAAGYLTMERLMDEQDGSMVMVTKPLFVCLAAKRQEETDPQSSSKAELLAQIKALQAQSDSVSRTGAISDGLHWSFWHIHNDGWYSYQQDTRDRYAAEKLLSLTLIDLTDF